MLSVGNGELVDMTYLEGAGHLIETPYTPHCKQSEVFLPFVTKNRKSKPNLVLGQELNFLLT